MNVSWSRGKYSPVLTYLLLWTAFVIFMLEYAGLIDLVRGLPWVALTPHSSARSESLKGRPNRSERRPVLVVVPFV